jgi:Ca2+-binding EF-hand superfamily protein
MKSIKFLALAGLVAFSSSAFAAEEKKGKADTDGDGAISKEELAAVPEKMQAKLKEHDKDGDGALSKEEYEAFKAARKAKEAAK